MREHLRLDQRSAGFQEMQIDRLLHHVSIPRIQSGRRDRPAACSSRHQENIPRDRGSAGRHVICDTDHAHAARHPVAENHVPADSERRAGNERHAQSVRDRRDPCRVVEQFRHVTVVCDMHIRDQTYGSGAHHIHIAKRRPGRMESRKEREIRQTRVHPVHCCNDILTVRLDDPAVIHLIDTDLCRGLPDHVSDLSVSVKVARTAGPHAELAHRNAGMFILEQIALQPARHLHFFDDGPREVPCKPVIDILYIQNAFLKQFFDFIFRNILQHASPNEAFHVHTR